MKEKIERALERTTDTKECLIGAGVVSRSAELFVKSFGAAAKAVVIADTNTWAEAGQRRFLPTRQSLKPISTRSGTSTTPHRSVCL